MAPHQTSKRSMPRRVTATVVAGALTTTALTTALTTAPAHATYPGEANGRLAFGMQIDGNVDVYTVKPDGGGLRRLTTDPGFDACATWSPSGRRIAFCSDRSGANEIWQMNRNGTRQEQVTHLASALWPDYSPDGSRIAFQATSASDPNPEIYTVRVDGRGLRQLTSDAGNNVYPAWSPDGLKIAFESDRTGVSQIWEMNPDGSRPKQLTSDAAPKGQVPDWKPDATQIAYSAGSADGNASTIMVMNADGSDQHSISDGPEDLGPAWSPDGSKLAFLDGMTRDIDVVNADGSNRHVIHHDGPQFVPAWQPRCAHRRWWRTAAPKAG